MVGNSKFFKKEALGGIILFAAACLGFILSNSPYRIDYEALINMPLNLGIGNFAFKKSLLFWINDGLVSIFFLFIGLEIKSMLYAEQAPIKAQLTLPLSTAISGAIVPALIYTFFNYDNPTNMRGWAIPTAMDTAFILGILSLLGRRIPSSLKIFVMSLSIMDDILAVLVIAIFYAEELSSVAIIASASIMGLLVLVNQASVKNGVVYLVLGFLLWLFVLRSGVHTSVAGVLIACAIPMGTEENHFLDRLKRKLYPLVTFIILPLFAFANTNVPLKELEPNEFIEPLSLGIIFGLFIGKQLGIFGVTYLLVKNKIDKLPRGTTWPQMYGASVLCGIGFTMSLFIGVLAFENRGPDYDSLVKASVFVGSLISAVFGYLILINCTEKSYS